MGIISSFDCDFSRSFGFVLLTVLLDGEQSIVLDHVTHPERGARAALVEHSALLVYCLYWVEKWFKSSYRDERYEDGSAYKSRSTACGSNFDAAIISRQTDFFGWFLFKKE